jgi:LemA protein
MHLGIAVLAALVAVGFVGWLVSVYNSLVQIRHDVDRAWANIDVVLQQRHDELTKLIDAVTGYMAHERELLTSLTRLRVGYDGARDGDEKVRIENDLNREVAKLRHVWESYPDLKASQNVIHLQARIAALESQIADRRELFNDSVTTHNVAIARFPDLLAAQVLGYARRGLLAVPEESKRDVEIAFG